MACLNNATCEFCDARCAAFIVDKQLWEELCKQYGVWCPLEDIEGIPYIKAIEYLKNMPTFSPQ